MSCQALHWTCVLFFILLLHFHSSADPAQKSCPSCSIDIAAFVDRVISSSEPPAANCIAVSKNNFLTNGVPKRSKRSTVGRHTDRIWNKYKVGHNYIIPYAITTNYDASQLARIQRAISEIEKNTCIKFKLIDTQAMGDYYKDKSHVEIKSVQGGGCHSVIGRKPGKNMVKLEIRATATKTCIAHHVIIHELLHLLGLYHEHQRPDRDDFINIHKERVVKGRIANFNIARGADTFGLPYDYCSIMHYRDVTFSASNLPVLTTKEPRFQAKLGKALNPSELDWLEVNILYGCRGHKSMLKKFLKKYNITNYQIPAVTHRHRVHRKTKKDGPKSQPLNELNKAELPKEHHHHHHNQSQSTAEAGKGKENNPISISKVEKNSERDPKDNESAGQKHYSHEQNQTVEEGLVSTADSKTYLNTQTSYPLEAKSISHSKPEKDEASSRSSPSVTPPTLANKLSSQSGPNLAVTSAKTINSKEVKLPPPQANATVQKAVLAKSSANLKDAKDLKANDLREKVAASISNLAVLPKTTKLILHQKMAKSSNGFVGEQYRRILAMFAEIPSSNGLEHRFHYAYGQIKLIEECLADTEIKSSLVKQLVSWALQEFNVSDFKNDIRMLHLWKLLGKYSVEYKMEGVMEKLNDLGFFKTKPEFYLAWAEHWTTQGNRSKVDSILKLCSDNCKLNSGQLNDLFSPLLSKFSNMNNGDTVALLNLLQKEKLKESSSSRMQQQTSSATKPVSKAVEDNTTTMSSRIYKNAIDVFANTLPYSEAQTDLHKTPEPSSNIKQAVPKEDFSVFCDEEIQVVSQKQKQMPAYHRIQNDVIKLGDSPMAKKTRKNEQQQQQLSFNEENLINNSSKEAERIFDMCVKRTPPDFMTDDVTVAGYHGKFACSLATSTPQRGGCSMAQGLNLFSPATIDGDGFFGEEQQKSDQVKLFNVHQPAGSSLHKRLSLSKNEADRIMAGGGQDSVGQLASSTEKSKKGWKSSATELVSAMPRLNIGNVIDEEAENKENEDLNETTGHGNIRETITGTVNPWDEQERNKILQRAPLMVEYHDFPEKRCPKIDLNRKIELSGEYFQIQKLLGEGGFAKVYKASTEDNQFYAIKYEIPPCPWEFYICASLRQRLAPMYLPFVMEIRDAFIFCNASAIVYDFYPLGTLLDLSNAYKKDNLEMGGLMVAFFGLQMGKILEQIHAARIIHADVKPDNVMLVTRGLPDCTDSLEKVFSTATIKIIDFGRAIDMNYSPTQEFIGRAGTKCFDCIEMISNRPWNYQTDFFGFVATIHVLIFNDYMQTHRDTNCNKIRPVKQIKRRLAMRIMWLDIFDTFLNIPDCQSLPSWPRFNKFMEEQLRLSIEAEPVEWKKSVERFNNYVKARV